jgi:putative transposase
MLASTFAQARNCGMTDTRPWHHRPIHVFTPDTMYMVTAGTLAREHLFRAKDSLRMLEGTLLEVYAFYSWNVQAWAVLANHYHIIAQSPGDGKSLKPMIQRIHSQTARLLNKQDNTPGRRVWFQYWDTCLTYENSYYPRLNYVHNNPLKHGLANRSEDYPYCSATWFRERADPAFRKKVESYRYDRLDIEDDF